MNQKRTESGWSGKLWLVIGATLVVGILIGAAIGLVSAPGPAPQRTFTVVAYHWGFALYDADGVEVPQIAVPRGTVVTLLVISAASLGHEVHEGMMERTIAAWENNTAFGDKTAMELMALMEEAEAQGLVDHAVRIPEFDVVAVTDHESPAPTQVTFVADKPGTFDILCGLFCGFGHAYMELEGGLAVS